MKKWLTIDIVLTFILLLWGALVRSMEAGLACPDWPLCHGKIIPPFELPILLEWTHRLLAALVGFVTLGIFIGIWRKEIYRKQIAGLGTFTFLLLIVQALLGAGAVKGLLKPTLVATHLGVGMIFLLMLTWVLLKLNDAFYPIPLQWIGWQQKLENILWLLTLFIFVQFVWGGYVSSSHAGLACPDFPTCLGTLWPSFIGNVGLHYTHRLLAYGIFVFILILFFISKTYPINRKFSKAVSALLMIVVFQMGFGILNVVYQLPVALRILHLAFGTMLVAMSFVTSYKFSHARFIESDQA